jgi:hypothetical protein
VGAGAGRVLGPVAFPAAEVPVEAVARAVLGRAAAQAVEPVEAGAAISGKAGEAARAPEVDRVAAQAVALGRALAVDPEADQGVALGLAPAVDWVVVPGRALEADQGVALELAPAEDRVAVPGRALEADR